MRAQERAEYHEYVSARTDAFRRFAYLTCGDWQRAEDAVQEAFIKLYKTWSRAQRQTLDAYTRRIITNKLIDEHRKGWFRRERPQDVIPETSVRSADSAERLTVLAALQRLPAKRRAILVLRYWEDQSVEQTAQIMNCSVHTVKSQTSRGFQTLRQQLSETMPQFAEGAMS